MSRQRAAGAMADAESSSANITEDIELLDDEEQKAIIDNLENEAKRMTTIWQVRIRSTDQRAEMR